MQCFKVLSCVYSTCRVDVIEETMKVLVDGKSCWVKIKEATSVTHYVYREDVLKESVKVSSLDDTVSWRS